MDLIKVALATGLDGAPHADELYEVRDLQEKIKLPEGNGYLHFTYSGQMISVQDALVPLFQESARTKIAE